MDMQQELRLFESEDWEFHSDFQYQEKEDTAQVKTDIKNIPSASFSEKRIGEKSLVFTHEETAENTSQSVGATNIKDDLINMKISGTKKDKSSIEAESKTSDDSIILEKTGTVNDQKIVTTTKLEKNEKKDDFSIVHKKRSSEDNEEKDTIPSLLQSDLMTKIADNEYKTSILKKNVGAVEKRNPSVDQFILEETKTAVVKNAKQTKKEALSFPVQSIMKKSRIILIGKTGTEKSATGNTILGDSKFNTGSAFVSCISRPQKESCICNGHLFEVTGLYNTSKTQEMVKQELAQCIEMCSPGLHVLLVKMSVGRVTEEEKNTLKYMSDLFGSQDFLNRSLLIVTRKEDLNPDMDLDDDDEEDFDVLEELAEFIGDSQELTAIVKQCNDRCLAISNAGKIKSPKRRKEFQKMPELIDKLIEKNEGNCYSNEMFKELEKQKEILRKEEERRRNDRKNALERKEMERILEKKKRQRTIDELEYKLEKENLDKLQCDSIYGTISDFRDQIEELKAEGWKLEQRTQEEFQNLNG